MTVIGGIGSLAQKHEEKTAPSAYDGGQPAGCAERLYGPGGAAGSYKGHYGNFAGVDFVGVAVEGEP